MGSKWSPRCLKNHLWTLEGAPNNPKCTEVRILCFLVLPQPKLCVFAASSVIENPRLGQLELCLMSPRTLELCLMSPRTLLGCRGQTMSHQGPPSSGAQRQGAHHVSLRAKALLRGSTAECALNPATRLYIDIYIYIYI